MKIVSDRLNSRAIAWSCSEARSSAPNTTASGFPVKGRSVKTSTTSYRRLVMVVSLGASPRLRFTDVSTATRVYVARLAGLAMFDPNGDQVGRVRDAVARMRPGSQPPRVVG